MFDTLISLLAFAGIVLSAYGLGRPVLRRLGVGQEDRLARTVWSLALGLVIDGMGLTIWGLLGGLSVSVIRWATAGAAAYGVFELIREIAASPRLPHSKSVFLGMAFAMTAVACTAALVSALAPAVAGDAVCYHLELPKVFLASGAFVHLPYHDNSTFPLLTEMWYLWALALDSAVAAQLVHWGLGVLLGLSTVLLSTPLVGRPWAWAAGCVAVLVPGVSNQMTAPLNDVALAVFTTLSLVAWREALERRSHRLFLLAGVMAGAALGIKYVALLFLVAVGATWVGSMAREAVSRALLLRGAAVVTLVAMCVGGVWYVRAAWHRGNPVYPFLGSILGGDGRPTVRESKTPLKWNALDAITAPWQVTMAPERFGGRGHQLGGLFLALLPGLVLVRQRTGLGSLLAIAVVYWMLWYALRQNVRFLFPLIPLLATAAACVLSDLARWRTAPRLIAAGTCAVLVAFMALLPVYRARRHVAVALGWESRDTFLARHEPTYRAAKFVNAHLPLGAHILSQDYRAFYFNRHVTREHTFRRVHRYPERLSGPREFVELLRGHGFTHVLLADAQGSGIRYNATLQRWATAAMTGQPAAFAEQLDYQFRDAEGTLRRYRLLEVRGSTTIAQRGNHDQRSADRR